MKSLSRLMLVLACSPVAANADWYGPYAPSTVESSENFIYFYLPPGLAAFPNPFGCAQNSWIAVDASTAFGNRALAMGLAAQAQGSKLKFNVTGCTAGNVYIKATNLQVDPNW